MTLIDMNLTQLFFMGRNMQRVDRHQETGIILGFSFQHKKVRGDKLLQEYKRSTLNQKFDIDANIYCYKPVKL